MKQAERKKFFCTIRTLRPGPADNSTFYAVFSDYDFLKNFKKLTYDYNNYKN